MHTTNDTTITVTPEYAAAKAAAEAGHPTTCVSCRRQGWVCAYSHTPRMSYDEANEVLRVEQLARAERYRTEQAARTTTPSDAEVDAAVAVLRRAHTTCDVSAAQVRKAERVMAAWSAR